MVFTNSCCAPKSVNIYKVKKSFFFQQNNLFFLFFVCESPFSTKIQNKNLSKFTLPPRDQWDENVVNKFNSHVKDDVQHILFPLFDNDMKVTIL